MEEETCETCLDVLIVFLNHIEEHGYCKHLGSQIEMMKLELNLLKMFFWGLSYLKELECDLHIRFAIKSMMQRLMQIAANLANKGMGTTQNQLNLDARKNMLVEIRQIAPWFPFVNGNDEYINLDVVMYDIGKTIDEHLRPQARDVCILLLGCTNYNCTSCPPNHKKFCEYIRDTTSFVELILQNLKALLNSNLIPSVMKQQIGLIQVELENYGTSVNLAEVKKLSELISCARTWFNRISCLTYLYLNDGKDESMSSITGDMLFGFLHNIIHVSTSGAISSMFQPTVIPQLLAWHLDLLLRDLVLPMKDDVEILQEALIFMLSFIMYPLDVDSKDSECIWAKLYATFNKFPSLIYSIRSGKIKEDICKAIISDFLMKVDGEKAKIRELFLMTPYTSQFPAPNTNVIGFLSSLVVNLSGILERGVNLIPCIKNLCESLYIELESFQPHLKSIMELLQGDKDKEIKHLWREMINMFYNVDYFTKLCLIRSFFTWWYVTTALSNFIERTMFMKIQIKKLVEVDKVHNKKKLGYHEHMDGVVALRPNGMVSENERGVVGFIEDEKIIIEKLLWGSKSLSIISISGSGGQGKTTLAKKIFNDPNVRCHFQSLVWVYVSKDCPVKKLLVQILSCIAKGGEAELGKDDVTVKIWKSLRGKRYLIILDDIWDVDAWEQLERLFPDDKYGSRVLFTTRNHDLASKAAKSNSISHRLPLFSVEESWELMKKGVFGLNCCDEEFVRIGKKISSHCRGLPLAVVLIAGVLGRIEKNMDSWNKVAKNLKAHLAQEGCGNVVELSYRYLQDHLKSCFLYFAAFPRGENVRAKELKLLWIGEGFADHDDLATKYLKDLVSLGLVDVSERSSMGEIKRCVVHDLLYDMCLEKAEEEKFMHLVEKSSLEWNIHPSIGLPKYNHHRLRIGKSDPFNNSIPMVIKRELPSSPLHTFLWLPNHYVSKHFAYQLFARFKIITVLKLKLKVKVFPEVILSCIYLGHLELHFEGRSNIRSIPPTISNLWKLRTLMINLWNPLILPHSIWDMESLRYVEVKKRLCLLDLEGFDQKNSGKSNIEALGTLRVEEDDSKTIEVLRKFSNLRKFKCATKIMGPWLLSMVGSLLPQLQSLNVRQLGYDYQNPIDWSFPYEIRNLTKLTLTWTQIPWSVLSKFGKQLPNLRVLKLLQYACKGKSWKLEDGDFSNLIYLNISNLDFKEIDISSCDNPLPCLEHLVIEYCWQLVEIPPAIGEIATLKTITVVEGSPKLKSSALGILEEQRELCNDSLQVFIRNYSL